VEVASSDDVKATVEPAEFSLGSGDVIDLQVRLSGDVPVGENQGFLLFRPLNGEENERPQRMAYCMASPPANPPRPPSSHPRLKQPPPEQRSPSPS